MFWLLSNSDGTVLIWVLTGVVYTSLDDVIQGEAAGGGLSPQLAIDLLGQHLQPTIGQRSLVNIAQHFCSCATMISLSQNSFLQKKMEGLKPWPCGCCAARDRGTPHRRRTSSWGRCGSSLPWLQLLFCLRWENRKEDLLFLCISIPDSLDMTAVSVNSWDLTSKNSKCRNWIYTVFLFRHSFQHLVYERSGEEETPSHHIWLPLLFPSLHKLSARCAVNTLVSQFLCLSICLTTCLTHHSTDY